MPFRRVRIVALVATLILAAVVFAPQTPWVRGWMLERVQSALVAQNYTLTYDHSAGNLWNEVRLADARIVGPGVDLAVEQLRVGYFLPGLITGELPLSLAASGVAGAVDIDQLPAPAAGPSRLAIRPVLDEVAVRDVNVAIGDIPFTIPDVTLTTLDLEETGDGFAFVTELATQEGSLRAAGRIGLGPFTLHADVERGDLAIARHWWQGITGGTVTGTFSIDEGGVRADAEVSGGSLAWLGLDVTDVAGPVRYQHPVIEGDLRGTALGGAARADAVVDIGARRWQGDVEGMADLPAVAGWVTRNLEFDSAVLDLAGDASYALSAAGWTAVTLEGTAEGRGTLLERPLRDLTADIRYGTDAGVDVEVTTAFAEGGVRAAVTTGREGLRIRGAASALEFGLASVPDAEIDLRFGADGPTGTGAASVRANVAGRPAFVALDLTADPEGLQLFGDGTVGDAALTGATVLDGSSLVGGARLVGWDVPGLTADPWISLAWDGTLAALDVDVSLEAAEPVTYDAAGIALDADLRGNLSGTLSDLRRFELAGGFGPIRASVSGDPSTGQIDVATEPMGIDGRVRTVAQVPAGTIRYGADGTTLEGRLSHTQLALPGIRLEPATWRVDGSLGPGTRLRAENEAGTATLTWDPPGLTAVLEGLTAFVGDRAATLDGRLELAPSEGLASLSADLRALLPEGEVSLRSTRGLQLEARLPAGFQAGPVRLSSPLELAGSYAPDAQQLQLTGAIGDVAADVQAQVGPAPNATVTLTSEGESAAIRLGGDAGLEVEGRLGLGPVAEALGLDLHGLVEADLQRVGDGYGGTARFALERPVPIVVNLTADGATVRAAISGTVGGQAVDLEGTLLPDLRLAGSVGPLDGVALAADGLAGTGQLPALTLGPVTTPPLAWSLSGSLDDRSAVLEVGASRAVLSFADGWEVDGDVVLPVKIGDLDATVRADVTVGSANPNGRIDGQVTLADSAGAAGGEAQVATFAGDRSALEFSLEAPADRLLDAFTTVPVLRGTVDLTGTIDLVETTIAASGSWRTENRRAELAVSGPLAGGLRATLDAADLSVAWTAGSLSVGGVGGDVAPYFDPALLARIGASEVSISGELERTPTAWDGSLEVRTDAAGANVVLEAAGDQLRVVADASVAGIAAEARGTLLPALAVDVTARSGPASLDANVSGPWNQVEVRGAIAVDAVSAGPVQLEPIALDLLGTLLPLDLRLNGRNVAVAVGPEGWSGAGTVSAQVAQTPQRIAFSLTGPAGSPTADVELSGPVEGTLVAGAGGVAGVVYVADAALPAAVPLSEPARIEVTAGTDLRWTAEVAASARLSGADVDLAATITGDRAAYTGSGQMATSTGDLANIALTGEGADLTLRIDAGALDPSALAAFTQGVTEVTGSGELVVRTAPFGVGGAIDLQGLLAGRELGVSFAVPDDGGIELDARWGSVVLALQAPDATSATFTAAATEPFTATLEGRISIDDMNGDPPDADVDGRNVRLDASGTVDGRPVALEAAYRTVAAPEPGGDPRFSLDLQSGFGTARVVLRDVVSGGTPDAGLAASVTLASDTGPLPFHADLEGVAGLTGLDAPRLDISGRVRLPNQDLDLDAALAASAGGVALTLAKDALVLRAEAGPGETAEDATWRPRVQLAGADALTFAGQEISVSTENTFVWTPGQGFAGTLELVFAPAFASDLEVGPVTARLTGRGDLRIALETPDDLLTGELVATARPWSDRSLRGSIELDVPARTPAAWGIGFTDDAPAASTTSLPGLQATLEIAGTWSAPDVQGAVTLTGPVAAEGSFRLTDGAARLDLEGPDLQLTARADAADWSAEASLRAFPAPVVPLEAARISGQFLADGAWGESPRVTVTEGRVASPQGSIGVEASLDDELAVALRVNLGLSELQIGPELTGRVAGPLVVRAPSLAAWEDATVQGALEVSDVGWSGTPGRLAGNLSFDGTIRDFDARARLHGTEGASGALAIDVDTASRRWLVESTLALGPLASDATFTLTPTSASAAGTVRWNDLVLALRDAPGGVALTGRNGLEGWEGVLVRDGWSLTLSGPLSGPVAAALPLADDVHGRISLQAGLDPSPAAELRLQSVTLGGRAFGDVTIGFVGLDAPLAIAGDHITGTFRLGGERDVDLTIAELPILPGLVLSAEAASDAAGIDLDGSVTGMWSGTPADLAFDGHLDGAWRLGVAGTLAGGTVDVEAERGAGGAWTGFVTLLGTTFGAQTLDLTGTLSGGGAVPILTADVRSSGPVISEGRIVASTDRVTLDQQLTVAGLSAPVTVEGTLWPQIDVRLKQTEDEALHLSAPSWSAPLTSEGRLALRAAGTDVVITGGPLAVRIAPPVDDLAFQGAVGMPGAAPLDLVRQIREEGLVLAAEGAAAGTIALELAPLRLRLADLTYDHPSGVAFAAAGSLSPDGGNVQGTLVVPPQGAAFALEGVPFGQPVPFEIRGEAPWTYLMSLAWPAGRLDATVDILQRRLDVDVDAGIGGGTFQADLRLSPDAGLEGTAVLDGVGLPTVSGSQRLALSGTLRGLRSEVDVSLRAQLNGSSAQVAGVWSLAGVVPGAFLPPGEGRRNLEVRLRTFDPTTLPALSARLPNLDVPLSGVLQIQPDRVFGRVLATELRVLDETLPLTLDVTGSFEQLNVQGEIGRSPIQIVVTPSMVDGYVRLERFPAHLAIEALLGETDVSAEVTGVLRGQLSLRGDAPAELRIATERIRLERAGVVTIGNVTASYIEGALTVDRAFFEGEGTYRASGVIRPDELDFQLRAQDADFGPLLGLVPSLARLGTGARGDLIVDTSGSLRDPSITVAVDGLDVTLAGGSYQIPTAQVRVRGTSLSTEGVVRGLQPIDGRVQFSGGGPVSLLPLRLERVELSVTGAADVPALGDVQDLAGTVAFGGGEPPTLDVTGSVGNPLRVAGTLAPLDLSIEGDGLAVRSPTFLVASSVLDVSATVQQEERGGVAAYVVRGDIFVAQARFELGIRPPATGERPEGPNPALERVVFGGVRIDAPRQLQLSENFGTLEGRADLTLGGTAAAPTLSGTASAVRGNVRFFGRDFDLVTAQAVFERARGIFPEILLEARTSADKSRVLAGITDEVRFVVPREGGTFDIDLTIAGELEPTPAEQRAFRLQVEPQLSSPARIEVRGESAIASGPRPLLDAELVSIVTLGRLEINPQLAGEQGLATAVAGTTLDTLVDFLVVSELQRSLSEALGVDVVEIRTSNLSDVFSGDGEDPFSVSLRLGGYLTDDLFASYRIGRFDDASSTLGFTNEVRFTYELGPVAFDLAGTVGFETFGTGAPIPGVSASVRYEISPLIDLETGLDVSGAGSRARFGVTLRW